MKQFLTDDTFTLARTGFPVDLGRLCADLAGAPGAPTVLESGPGQGLDEDLLRRLLLAQLRESGVLGGGGPGGGGSVDSWAARHPLSRELRCWLHESIRILREHGLLVGEPGCPREAAGPDPDPWPRWDEARRAWSGDGGLGAQAALLDATLRAVPRILTGAVPATDVVFPEASMRLVEGIYTGNAVTDAFNRTMADVVGAVVRAHVAGDRTARLRLLEVGAGTGGGSLPVLERLAPFAAQIDSYCYTDLSRAFLLHAEREYGPRFGFLDYAVLDITEPLAGQGLEPGSYDLVLATNVLHATKDIRRTVRNAKAALVEHGVLLLDELATHSLFAHLTFGLLEGWWLYEDADLRIPGCPALAPGTWQEVLEDEGFEAVSFPAAALHPWGYQVVAACSDGVIRQSPQAPAATRATAPGTAAAPSFAPPSSAVPSSAVPVPPREVGEVSGNGPSGAGPESGVDPEVLDGHVRDIVFEQLFRTLKLDRDQLAVDDAFMDHGIDSILGVQLIQGVNRRLGIELSTTDLFDHGSVEQLAERIVTGFRPQVLASLPGGPPVAAAVPGAVATVPATAGPAASTPATVAVSTPATVAVSTPMNAAVSTPATVAVSTPVNAAVSTPVNAAVSTPVNAAVSVPVEPYRPPAGVTGVTGGTGAGTVRAAKEPIAIVGMSGRFARSADLDDLWDHLAHGRDLVEEVRRWDLSAYYPAGADHCRHGSFLDDIDQFDPVFFNISGVEATYMDPQQRVFLQECWQPT